MPRDTQELHSAPCGHGRACSSHSLFTGSTFCGEAGCAWAAGSWFSSSFLLRMSLKKMRIRGTPHRNCSCLVTKGIDSLRLGEKRRPGGRFHPAEGQGEPPRFPEGPCMGRCSRTCHSTWSMRSYFKKGEPHTAAEA